MKNINKSNAMELVGKEIVNVKNNVIGVVANMANGKYTVIVNEEEKIYLTVDGQKAMEVNQKSCVKINKKQKNVKLLLFNDYDYFKVLRNKILNNSKECDGEEF